MLHQLWALVDWREYGTDEVRVPESLAKQLNKPRIESRSEYLSSGWLLGCKVSSDCVSKIDCIACGSV